MSSPMGAAVLWRDGTPVLSPRRSPAPAPLRVEGPTLKDRAARIRMQGTSPVSVTDSPSVLHCG